MTDDEMLKMPIAQLQRDGGLVFVWVTGRALELGRDCMRTWGWVKIHRTQQIDTVLRSANILRFLGMKESRRSSGWRRISYSAWSGQAEQAITSVGLSSLFLHQIQTPPHFVYWIWVVWIDHSKEHCLVGFKRPLGRAEGTMTAEEVQEALSWVKRGIDTDVIVAEVSHLFYICRVQPSVDLCSLALRFLGIFLPRFEKHHGSLMRWG